MTSAERIQAGIRGKVARGVVVRRLGACESLRGGMLGVQARSEVSSKLLKLMMHKKRRNSVTLAPMRMR